jgi:hypothetical protein
VDIYGIALLKEPQQFVVLSSNDVSKKYYLNFCEYANESVRLDTQTSFSQD